MQEEKKASWIIWKNCLMSKFRGLRLSFYSSNASLNCRKWHQRQKFYLQDTQRVSSSLVLQCPMLKLKQGWMTGAFICYLMIFICFCCSSWDYYVFMDVVSASCWGKYFTLAFVYLQDHINDIFFVLFQSRLRYLVLRWNHIATVFSQ